MPSAIRIPGPMEADIERTITDWLALDGWRSFKMEQNFSEKKQKSVGESGMADHLYIRYDELSALHPEKINYADAQVMWCEFKRPLPSALGPRATKAQLNQVNWHAQERARGALTLIAGVDFVATIEGFQEWYRASGLMRRNLR